MVDTQEITHTHKEKKIYSKHKRHKSFGAKLFLIHNYNKSLSQFEQEEVRKHRSMCKCAYQKVLVRHSLPFYPRHLFSFTCSDFFVSSLHFFLYSFRAFYISFLFRWCCETNREIKIKKKL